MAIVTWKRQAATSTSLAWFQVLDLMTTKVKMHGYGASSNTQPLGATLAKIIAMLVEKHNCTMAVFKDETLFWNWAKSVSDDPVLQAISIAGPAVFREASHLMRNAALLYASQGDCFATDVVPESQWFDSGPCVEDLVNLTPGEMATKHFVSGSKDFLAMGDVATEPARYTNNPWCDSFDLTRQLDYLDFEQEGIETAEGRLAECSVFWPNAGVSSRSESRMTQTSDKTCSSSSIPSSNSKGGGIDHVSQFGASMKEDNNRAGAWNPTWLGDFIRACPDAEVPPIFQKIQNEMESDAGKAAAQSEARGTESKASSSGSFAESSVFK